MTFTVIGCGRWGSFIAWYLNQLNKDVTLYGRKDSAHINQFIAARSNGQVTFNDKMKFETELSNAIESDVIIISVPSQSLRALLNEIKAYNIKDKKFILCMKGIEIESGKRLTEVFKDVMGNSMQVAVWLGPGHPQEFVNGVPNCMVIDSENDSLKSELIELLKGPLIRFYYGNDIIGNEIGAASKNVIGIAAGILDGIGMSSLKGALMSRGTREIARLIKKLGGNELSAYGLCHLGDYEATVFSQYSHNREFGEKLAKGEKYTSLAEGYYTAKALKKISENENVELPICNAIYNVLYENKDINEEISKLFIRELKKEF